MTAFAGWLGTRSGSEVGPTLRKMLEPDAPGVEPQSVHGDDWALATAAGARPLALHSSGDRHAVVLGEPSWPDDMGTDGTGARPVGLLDGSVEQLARVGGGFAIAVLDASSRRLVAAVDRFSTFPVYYAQVGEGVVFGTSPRIVARHPQVPDSVSPQSVFDFIYSTVVPAPHTIFAAVGALLPGSALEFRDGSLACTRYWAPQFAEDSGSQVGAEGEERVRQLLRESVAADAAGSTAIGCFLSGGIDSSSIVGMLREATGERPRTFSIGFEAEGYDELEYARLVARHFDAEHHEYYVKPADIIDLIPSVSRAYGQPFGNSSVVPTFHCATLARQHGVQRMLAGDGGDELFGGNERYAAQWVFDYFARVPDALRGVLSRWALAESPIAGGLPGVRKAVSYVRHASVPLPDRLDVFNYVNRLGTSALLEPEFAAQIDDGATLRDRRRIFSEAEATTDLDRMLALDFKITLADNDLPKVTVMCERAGMDVRFPFLRDALVDFSCALPARDKVHRTRLRYFFKRAMGGFLPDAVIAKRKHGFGLPFGIWVNRDAALRDYVFDILGAAQSRGFVSSHFLGELRNRLLAEQPRYYGPLVWTIILLEVWLRENA